MLLYTQFFKKQDFFSLGEGPLILRINKIKNNAKYEFLNAYINAFQIFKINVQKICHTILFRNEILV